MIMGNFYDRIWQQTSFKQLCRIIYQVCQIIIQHTLQKLLTSKNAPLNNLQLSLKLDILINRSGKNLLSMTMSLKTLYKPADSTKGAHYALNSAGAKHDRKL